MLLNLRKHVVHTPRSAPCCTALVITYMFTGSWVFAVSVTRSFRVHSTIRQKGGVGLRLNQLQTQSTGQELNYKLTPQRTCQGSLTDYHQPLLQCFVWGKQQLILWLHYNYSRLRVGKFLHEDLCQVHYLFPLFINFEIRYYTGTDVFRLTLTIHILG